MARDFICRTCGTQFSVSEKAPEGCLICEDERQFVGLNGQEWTTLEELESTHHNVIQAEELGLHSIITEPDFAIGERAFVVQTAEGNLLWDCLALLDNRTFNAIQALGGLRAIAISHPHYYTTMAEWSRRFGNIPIHLHTLDREWVVARNSPVQFWDGAELELFGRLKLVWTGGHFAGYQVL